jgi:chloride channel protein, CIC family
MSEQPPAVRPARRLPGLDDLTAFARLFEFRTVSRWVGLGVAVGVVSGLGAAAFFVALDWLRQLVLGQGANFTMLDAPGEHSLFGSGTGGPLRAWLLVLAPAAGGLISGLLVYRLCPEAEGGGNDAVIEAFHRHKGRMRRRVPLIKGLASVVLLGTGGSAGREGPIAQIGAGVGSLLGRALRLSDHECRLLLLAGAAGGIGAIFRTPLGAALFVVEVLYKDDFEVDALVPTVLSSVVAYSVFTMLFGEGHIFATEHGYAFDPRQLPFYLLMAIGTALIGVVFIKVFYGMRDHVFAPLRLPRYAKPMIGGLCVGLLGLAMPQALGTGYGWLQEAIVPKLALLPGGWMGALLLLAIALLKVLTTSFSVASGGSGGVFGPSVVIGGMVGGAFGLAFHELAPSIVPQPGAFVIVGMAAFLGGVAHAPISSLVIASEMTGSYDLLVPIMLAEAVTFVMMRRWTLYEKQVATRRDSPAHGAEYVFDVLQHVRVREVFDPDATIVPIAPSTPMSALLRHVTDTTQAVFPVLGKDGQISGVVTLETLRGFLFDEDVARLAIAADCAVPLVSVGPDDSLATALERFASSHFPELPVVEPGAGGKILGLLGYEELLEAYSQELLRRRQDSARSPESSAHRHEVTGKS